MIVKNKGRLKSGNQVSDGLLFLGFYWRKCLAGFNTDDGQTCC
ncbi:hypothetical protein NEISUBOT_03509 [Neisseria subflava NJ9703]|uniref:Uncharacterized protein n=1 Tax=Neisseria subflava NJ9703 TaxID=546268 RepID=A0A9W5ITK9_NEISU|nr:hypothetical protein NEISUBOT_03509 [Neisseria subflava NJ9703]